jgi:hypothetical protein
MTKKELEKRVLELQGEIDRLHILLRDAIAYKGVITLPPVVPYSPYIAPYVSPTTAPWQYPSITCQSKQNIMAEGPSGTRTTVYPKPDFYGALIV